MAERARATGEAHFEDVKSADGPITPSSVLGRTTSADGPTRRLPVQLTHNRIDDWLASTDGKMAPARAESTETSELFDNVREFENVRERDPLVNVALDAVEGHLQQTTESSVEERLLRTTESSTNSQLPQTQGSAVGNYRQPTTDCSKATTIVVPAECTSARTIVYSNSNPVDPFIIIDDTNQHCPEMGSDTAGEPECFERGDQDATVTTTVAGAE